MTKKDISKLLDIPLATLNDWQKEDSNRHKLYEFLRSLPKKEYKSIKQQQKEHPIFYVLNRNIDKKERYIPEDIKKAFGKTNYIEASPREKVLYSKFFKECDPDDLKTLIDLFDLSIRNIKQIYLSSPLRKLKGVREVWDRRFRITSDKSRRSDGTIDIEVSPALRQVLEKRVANV